MIDEASHALEGLHLSPRHGQEAYLCALNQHVVRLPLAFDGERQAARLGLALSEEKAVVAHGHQSLFRFSSGDGTMAVDTCSSGAKS